MYAKNLWLLMHIFGTGIANDMQCQVPLVEFTTNDCSSDTTCLCGRLLNKELESEVGPAIHTLKDLADDMDQLHGRIPEKLKQIITDKEAEECYDVMDPSDLPANCKQVFERGNDASGIYLIKPSNAPKPFQVLCERNVDGSGWTVILNRYCGEQTFELGWDNYKIGFGHLNQEFWLGLQHIHELTNDGSNELYVLAINDSSVRFRYKYSMFKIGSEDEGYKLTKLGNTYIDTSIENMKHQNDNLRYSVGSKFSTPDRDQDNSENNCAKEYSAGWWYNDCIKHCNPMGKCGGDPKSPNLRKYFHWTGVEPFVPTEMKMMLGPPYK